MASLYTTKRFIAVEQKWVRKSEISEVYLLHGEPNFYLKCTLKSGTVVTVASLTNEPEAEECLQILLTELDK